MHRILIDFNKKQGKVKPMHATNNGPAYKANADQRITNMPDYQAAGIPFARNHDASFFATYGGEHTVDVNFIFPNFDADPYDENSYDFACTDEYLRVIALSGAETFYRLGSKIEHGVKKYNTLPPKDFNKWAVICEHIIKHYNEGWANGFAYNLTYWEIWNEPDLDPDDSANKRTWGGTAKQFYELYCITANHLKEKFPRLKIGGPSLANYRDWWVDEFLQRLTKDEKRVPLDFFSWHIYTNEPQKVVTRANAVRQKLNAYGYTRTESICNEWNYVRGWEGDSFLHSLRAVANEKGAAFTAAVMCLGQEACIDMLMYYDARPYSGFNGLWKPNTYDRLKGYYPFYCFNKLYRLGESVSTVAEGEHLYACAATGQNGAAAMIACYSDKDDFAGETFTLTALGIPKGAALEVYAVDSKNDFKLVATRKYNPKRGLKLCIKGNGLLLVQTVLS